MKKIFLLFIVFAMLISTVYASDVEKDVIPLLSQLDIMKGDLDGNLRLDDFVTRAEFTKVAIAASVYKNSVAKNINVSPYRDVTHAHWAAPYIKIASANKLVNGYVDGSFKPDDTVLYEEALNVVLKLLGYTDDDFGTSWPYGQVSLAQNLGLTDDLDKNIGDNLKRADVAKIIYNLFNVKSKASTTYYIEKLNYKILKDEVLIATPDTDTSVGSGKILTSQGTFKTNLAFDSVGKKGNFIIKNNDEVIAFMPSEQIINEYLVYQVLQDEIIVSENGSLKPLSIENDLVIYNKSQKTTLKDTLAKISVGDTVTTYKTANGVLDYGMVNTQNLEGPYTVYNTEAYKNAIVIRDGIKTSEVKVNDIVYISKALNTVWAYSKKVTGIYESALPNKDNPTSVTISGKSYTIESGTAFEKLSSNGNYKFGDTLTILLGRDGKIADVVNKIDQSIVGYLVEAGTKTFDNPDGNTYTAYYVKIAQADGETYEYVSQVDYAFSKNRIVKVVFEGTYARVSALTPQNDLYGRFDYIKNKIGNINLSSDVRILDVSTNDSNKTGSFIKVFPQRLDGMTISGSSVRYYQKNEKGEIELLFLNNSTGDMNKYGIVTKAENSSSGMNSRGSYTYDIGGVTNSMSTSTSSFSVQSGQPAKFEMINNKIEGIAPLAQLQGTISNVADTYVEIGSNRYAISDKVTVYQKTSDFKYLSIPFSDIVGNSDYKVTAYVDKAVTDGGRIRVLVATK